MESTKLQVSHVIRGEVRVPGEEHGVEEFADFITPSLDLDELIWPRTEPGPAFDLPLEEIIDFLVEFGQRLDLERNEYLQEALEKSIECSALGERILRQTYSGLGRSFTPEALWFQIDREIGREYLDGWKEIPDQHGRIRRVRAFPPRLVHILAGNAPGVTGSTVLRGALTKGVSLLKLPSNDLFTGTAMLRTLADVDPDHPITQSFSAVYWRGGDPAVEGALFRSQYFDRLVAWGGDAAIRSAIQYVAPGFDLVSFDPKVSISLVGGEALESEASLAESATAAAVDISIFNQEVCAASRFVYAEGTREDLRPWCERLVQELGVERTWNDAVVPTLLPDEVRDEIKSLQAFDKDFEVFGSDDGRGMVILTDEPVKFHPSAKTVNVVAVPSLQHALRYVNVATQTIGLYPASRSPDIRDQLAAQGMQRLVPLGDVMSVAGGFPHDGFYPMARFVKWLVDDC